MRLSWRDLGTPRADMADGRPVEIIGFPLTPLPTRSASHFLMMAEPARSKAEETAKLLGGNCRRVFDASLG